MLCRLHSHMQYSQLFRYGEEKLPITTDQSKEKSARWSRLPWYLQSNLSLQEKRLIAQLRQGGVHTKCNGMAVSIPHMKDELECTFCNLKDVDCHQHALFECPITAITSLSLERHGWKLDNVMEFLDTPWQKPKGIQELVFQCIRMPQLILEEVSTQ